MKADWPWRGAEASCSWLADYWWTHSLWGFTGLELRLVLVCEPDSIAMHNLIILIIFSIIRTLYHPGFTYLSTDRHPYCGMEMKRKKIVTIIIIIISDIIFIIVIIFTIYSTSYIIRNHVTHISIVFTLQSTLHACFESRRHSTLEHKQLDRLRMRLGWVTGFIR